VSNSDRIIFKAVCLVSGLVCGYELISFCLVTNFFHEKIYVKSLKMFMTLILDKNLCTSVRDDPL